MIDFLLGVPGKLKTITDYLTANLSTGRAARIDNLDALTSSRAAAASALSNATWSDARAEKLSNAAQHTDPMQAPPIAANFGITSFAIAGSTPASQIPQANTTSTTDVDVISITGSGVLKAVTLYTTAGGVGYVTITVDGVIIVLDANCSGLDMQRGVIGVLTASSLSLDNIPFRVSLLVRHRVSASTTRVYTGVLVHRTS